jgi:hypothetical protein
MTLSRGECLECLTLEASFSQTSLQGRGRRASPRSDHTSLNSASAPSRRHSSAGSAGASGGSAASKKSSSRSQQADERKAGCTAQRPTISQQARCNAAYTRCALYRCPELTQIWTEPPPESGSCFSDDCEALTSSYTVSTGVNSRATHGTREQELGSRPAHRPILAQPAKSGNGRNVHEREEMSTVQRTGFHPRSPGAHSCFNTLAIVGTRRGSHPAIHWISE